MPARKPPELVAPDERWQLLEGTHADLVQIAAGWRTDPRVSKEVAEMLATCRNLFTHSYFAVIWSLLALKAALRDGLGADATRDDGLKKLVGKAEGRGWFTHQEADALRGGVELRNRLVHARAQGVLSAAAVAPMLAAAHDAVAHTYERVG